MSAPMSAPMSAILDCPQPGEVWIVTEKTYERSDGVRCAISWPTDRPFIVLYLTTARIGFACAGAETGPYTGWWSRGEFPWHEQCTRLWPPVPSWEEIKEDALRRAEHHPGDLRAHALKGNA